MVRSIMVRSIMVKSMTSAGFVLVGLTAYALGQHTRIPELVLAQGKVAHLVTEAERTLDPILKKLSNDKSEQEARHNALPALPTLRDGIRELRETTDRQVDKIVATAKK
jgi:hypothetical protein